MRLPRAEAVFVHPAVLAIAATVVLVLPLLAIGELSAADTRDRLRASAASETELFAERTAAAVNGRLLAIRDGAALAARSTLSAPFAQEDTVALQAGIHDLRPLLGGDVTRLSIANATGDVLATDPSEQSILARKLGSAEPLWSVAMDRLTERPYLSSPFKAALTSRVSVVESVPISTGRRGILVAEIDLTALSRALPSVPTRTTASYVVDESGRFVMGQGAAQFALADMSGWPELVRIRQDPGRAMDGRAPDGGAALVAGEPVPEIGWYAIAAHERGTAEADLEAALSQARVVRAILGAFLVIGSYVFARAAGQIARQRRALDALVTEVDAKNRQLALASKNKSDFLANMSHELRTPLNAIIGFSEVLSQRMFGDINEKQQEYLKDILTSGHHLLALINDVLDLSKVEAGRSELDPTDFSLRDVLESSLVMVRERASKHGVELGLEVTPDLELVRGDERKIKQIVFNLLSNAVKFTPAGGRVDVRARRLDGGIEVSVRDTGAGIPESDRDLIFEEFRQSRDGAKAEEGTGLGLTLTKKLVQLHGGNIRVESTLGVGSTFTFTLPLGAAGPP